MADSCCIAELKQTIEKLNVELSQSSAKIAELDAKVREQEEENTRLTRDLKECEEKCTATQKRLEFAEQKLAQFSHKPQTAAQIRQNLINDGSSSCSDGSDSDEDRQNPSIGSSSSCSDGPDSDDSPTHKFDEETKENNAKTSKLTSILKGDSKIRRNPINDGSSSCSDGSDSDEDRRNPISNSSSSCSDGPDSDDSLTHVRHPQISLSLVEKDGTSGGVKYVSNIKHMLKRKRPDEETKENNVKTIKLTSILKGGSKIKKFGDAALNINSMPEEIFIKIFGYLSHNDLGRTVQVCRRWNVLTKSPVLWRKVNAKIYSSDRKKDTVAKSFINGLPSCVTCIRLDFVNYRSYISNFEEVCAKLHQNCPHVEELILEHCAISNIFPEVINFCTQFLQRVKKLVFHHCHFSKYSRTVELNDNSKIEVLDLYVCKLSHFNKTQFSKLLHLKELRLTSTNVNDTWFVENTSFFNQLHVLNLGWTYITARTFLAIHRHGHNLKELYLCKVHLRDHDLNFNKSAFPRLKTICLSDSFVTCEGVVSLIQSCPSLENVYVDEDVAESFAAHPFVLSNKCKSGIVKAIDSYHIHNVDYIHN